MLIYIMYQGTANNYFWNSDFQDLSLTSNLHAISLVRGALGYGYSRCGTTYNEVHLCLRWYSFQEGGHPIFRSATFCYNPMENMENSPSQC